MLLASHLTAWNPLGVYFCGFSSSYGNPYGSSHSMGKYEVYGRRRDAKVYDSFKENLVSSGERFNLIGQENSKLSVSMLYYACNGPSSKWLEIWEDVMESSITPDANLIVQLIVIFGNMQDFAAVSRILHDMLQKDAKLLPGIFALAISCFGKRGQLHCMRHIVKEMVSLGYSVDSSTGNAYLLYYSAFGSLSEMENAYGRLKRSRILIEEEAIRAVSLAYIKQNKFYDLGRFVADVGLNRKNVGNLLWNLLLLSYAAKFKMKSLQREFVRMVEAGFSPDLDTFNIRALAFSRMSMMWDLHLSLKHMKHEAVVPDLVTYGCVVDAYMDRKLARNLDFPLSQYDWDKPVSLLTDPIIFEALGKGDFHLSSDSAMEYTKERVWTYKMLISNYMKKKLWGGHIFWKSL